MRHSPIFASVFLGLIALPVMLAQSAGFTPRKDLDQIPSYELVSIHKVAEATVGGTINDNPDGFTARDSTLVSLIAEGYGFSLGGLRDQQLVGAPAWSKTQLFEIRAKVDSASVPKLAELTKAATMQVEVRQMVARTPTVRMVMLQRLLEDRFKLQMHYEQRVLPTYQMTVAKGGVKMKASHPENPENGNLQMDPGKLAGSNVPLPFLGAVLAQELERPVEDKTGDEGNYDFELRWARIGDAQDDGTKESSASIFTAVQEQLGLKLRAAKGPVWVVVVDHAEMPSEN